MSLSKYRRRHDMKKFRVGTVPLDEIQSREDKANLLSREERIAAEDVGPRPPKGF